MTDTNTATLPDTASPTSTAESIGQRVSEPSAAALKLAAALESVKRKVAANQAGTAPATGAIALGIDLGVEGLDSDKTKMGSGGLYAIQVTTPSTRFALLSSCIKSAVTAGIECTLITSSSPEEVIKRLSQSENFSALELIKQKRIKVFAMQDEFSKKIFRFGADRFVQEIEDFEIPANSFIVFEQADEVLSLHDLWLASQQIKVLGQWFKRRQMTGLMAFTRSNAQQTAALNALMDNLAGLARLGGDRDGLELTFLYWQSTQGVMAARNFNLRSTEQGHYKVSHQTSNDIAYTGLNQELAADAIVTSGPADATTANPITTINSANQTNGLTQTSLSLDTTNQIVAQIAAQLAHSRPTNRLSFDDTNDSADLDINVERGRAMRGAGQFFIHNDLSFEKLTGMVPGKFYFAQSMADVVHSALQRPNAVILLSVPTEPQFTAAANVIHSIRKNCGPREKIVVRETTHSLSDQQKMLLTLCGVNDVFALDLPLSTLTNELNQLAEKQSNVQVDDNFEIILQSVTTSTDASASPAVATRHTNSETEAPRNAQRVIEKAKRSALRTLR